MQSRTMMMVVPLLMALEPSLAAQVTPVQKVLQLLDGMKTKGTSDMESEQSHHAEYIAFCEQTLTDKRRSIEEANELSEQLTADIEKSEASINTLSKQLQMHENDIAAATKDKEEAVQLRKQEATDYDLAQKDYVESIDAVGRALRVLKARAASTPQAEDDSLVQTSQSSPISLLDISTNSRPREVNKVLSGFLQSAQPAAAGYDFQSSGVVEMLEKLESKFLDEKGDLELAEKKRANSHELVLVSLTSQLAASNEAKDKKTGFKNRAEQALATAKSDLAEAQANLVADTKYRKDLDSECKKTASDFAEKQKVRQEELKAIEKAREVIAGDAVAGSSAKHMPGRFIQEAGTALASLRTSLKQTTPSSLSKALKLLQKRAEELGSHTLSLLVEQASAAAAQPTAVAARSPDGAMKRIKDMMQNLLEKMQGQQAQEITHKSFCDKELGTSKITRAAKTDAVDTLSAEIDQLQTSIAKLTEDSSEISVEITKISTAMSEATKLRQDEKAQNTETVADAEAAKTAVGQALGVLQDFYSSAGEASSFVQRDEATAVSHAAQPSTYSGMQGQATGVIGMLEVIMEDFSRLEVETKATEQTSAEEYRTFMEDSRVDKAEKEANANHKQEKKEEQSTLLAQKQSDLVSSQTELTAANKYYEELHGQCLSADSEAEKERLKREAEIESMKAALQELGAL